MALDISKSRQVMALMILQSYGARQAHGAGVFWPVSDIQGLEPLDSHATTTPMDAEVRFVQRHYIEGDPVKVGEFLGDNPSLYPVLIDARSRIAEVFGGASPVRLRVVNDYESPGEQILVVGIQVPSGDKYALEKLDHLDEEWWLLTRNKIGGVMAVDIERV